MANILSLAMKINADASGFKLDPVQRALVGLGTEADKVTAVFDKFKVSSDAAGRVQEQFAKQAQGLINALRDGGSATQFAADFERLAQAAREEADAFERAAEITKKYTSAEADRATQLAELNKLRDDGKLKEDIYAAAVAEVSGANKAAADAAKQQAEALAEAAKITDRNRTAVEKFDAELVGLNAHLDAGRISPQIYSREVAKLAKDLTAAERVARGLPASLTELNAQTLKFNELSGVFSALPGPLGNIAGRVSGLSSAAEGLGRVFSGGLRQGFSSIGASLAGLINPLTAAIAGVTAFAASARTIAAGLGQLEDRVENLGNTADKLGISFEFVQVLDEAARRSGTSIDAVSAAFGRLQKSVLGVDEESKAAQAALAQIGVTAEQLQALKPEEQYQLIGQRIAAIEEPARRTATSISLFGRAGADLLPFFRNIGGAADDLNRVGAVLGDAQRRDIDEFGGAMDRLTVATRGAGEQILASFAPAGEAIANSLAQASGAVAKFIEDQNNAANFSREFQELQRGLINRRATDAELALLRSGQTAEEVLRRVEAQAKILRDTGEFVSLTDGLVEAAIAGKDAAAGVEQVAAAVDQITQLSSKSQDLLSKAIQQVGQYGEAGLEATVKYQEALREVDALIADEGLSEEQAARARANVTAEYERQMDVVKQAANEKKKAADLAQRDAEREVEAIQSIIDKTLEQIRVEQDFGGDTARARNAADLQRISAEIAKAEAEIARASEDGDRRNEAAATARLAQLDQVRAALAETEAEFAQRADEVAQGFADGFDKAFAATTQGLDGIIGKAAQFGNEGARAARELEDGIARAQQQVRAGILTQPAYDAEVAVQRRIAEERIAQLAALEKLDQDRRQREFQGQVEANERLNALMQGQMTERQRLEAQAIDENLQRRQKAAENLLAIEQRIATQRQAIEAAREQNDNRAAKARVVELRALEQLQKQERQIADGKVEANRQVNNVAQANAAAQQSQLQAFSAAAQRQVQATQTAANDAISATNAAFAQAAERQRKIFNDLNTLGSRTVQTADVRTAEGAAIVLGLAANAQDPRLIEQRLSNKILRQISTGLVANLNRIGIPAFIPG